MATNSNYVSRGFTKNVQNDITTSGLAQRFTNMLNNVEDMINEDGPIYHTWISFQIGKTEPIVFNTDSTNPNQNLIASLDVQKSGAYTCNNFTLKIVYDPFNYGQDTKTQIELLDEMVAMAMSYDMEDDDSLRGYLQYGYTSTSSNELVSPYYEFMITDVDSNTKVSSGITSYTFEGTCTLSTDCNYSAPIGTYTKDWKFMDVIIWTIFYHYGDNAHKPIGQTGECMDNEFKYRIECPEDIYNDSTTVGDLTDGGCFDAVSSANPITYCEELMTKYPLLKSEFESGKYDNLDELDYANKPRFEWYLTDTDGVKVFHIVHVNPETDDSITSSDVMPLIDYTFTWGDKKKSLVTDWNPQVDTKLYLIRKALYIRNLRRLDDGNLLNINNINNDDYRRVIRDNYKNNVLRDEQQWAQEQYDASITLVGIPADPPISARVKVIPRILESVSRTAGTYIVQSAEDHITANGVYSTTLNLFRIDDEYGTYTEYKERIAAQQSSSANSSSQTSSTTTDNLQQFNTTTSLSETRINRANSNSAWSSLANNNVVVTTQSNTTTKQSKVKNGNSSAGGGNRFTVVVLVVVDKFIRKEIVYGNCK